MPDTAVLTALRDFLERDPHGCAAVYLFGSRAREDYRADSDVDVAVLWEREPDDTFAELQSELEDVLRQRVDVRVLNHAPADFRHRVATSKRMRALRFGSAMRHSWRSTRLG